MNLPFQQVSLESTIKDQQLYYETRDMLKAFAKHLPVKANATKWVQIDKEMAGEPNSSLPYVFKRVVQYDMPFVLKIVPTPMLKAWESIHNEKIRASAVWKTFGEALKEAESDDLSGALVLFHIAHMGLWVLHNMEPPEQGLHICIPAQIKGKSNIIIEPMKAWAERNFTNE